ncbi:ATP-grasp domain-containing protein [Pseudobacteroides cellulosolvens]|uniref:ATP-grasp domain-containing protein n=1 Tax=Pseudobacteroides cellulosolvens TaxID=35825 RepID=UPI0023EA6486|nr:ATP-grasp domain-containing protein [Pseudobacteroides cellulosolvens]
MQQPPLILVCKPKQIEKEWRNIIVKGKVVSSSRYSVYGKKSVDSEDIPDEMIQFAEDCCKVYNPHDVFVMDVALKRDNFYIIECNCFNDSGFYDHDIGEIVKSINNYMRERN